MKFTADQSAKIEINITDGTGSLTPPQSVAYSLYDADDVAILTDVAFTGDVSTSRIIIEIDSAHNVISTTKDVRRLEVTATLATGEVTKQSVTYILEQLASLVVGVNSYQTYQSSVMNADDVHDLYGFDNASDGDRKAALKEAYYRIGTMTFNISYADSMSRLASSNIISNLDEKTDAELKALPEQFLNAIRLAQVIEADSILGGNETEDLRESGLLSKTVGESSQMFRSGVAMKLPLSKRAYQVLKRYTMRNNKIGRA